MFRMFFLFQTFCSLIRKLIFHGWNFLVQPFHQFYCTKKKLYNWDFQPIATSIIYSFTNYLDFNCSIVDRSEYGAKFWNVFWYMSNNRFILLWVFAYYGNCVFVHFIWWFSLTIQDLPNQWAPDVHVGILSSSERTGFIGCGIFLN